MREKAHLVPHFLVSLVEANLFAVLPEGDKLVAGEDVGVELCADVAEGDLAFCCLEEGEHLRKQTLHTDLLLPCGVHLVEWMKLDLVNIIFWMDDQDLLEQANQGDNEAGEYEDESDDDVEIIMDTATDDAQTLASAKLVTAPISIKPLLGTLPASLVRYNTYNTNIEGDVSAAAGAAGAGVTVTPGSGAAPGGSQVAMAATKSGAIDINLVGQIDGKDLFDVDLDGLDDKPWRKPGADITDYFNFGFNEVSWRAYCNKQKSIREEALMQKRIHTITSSGS
ncbi:Fip1 motif-domain-containing protein [Chytriomyces sp. MP71]|nr:Fip1 motif-domain-containing protein [Chytriomyces sp. MP71]